RRTIINSQFAHKRLLNGKSFIKVLLTLKHIQQSISFVVVCHSKNFLSGICSWSLPLQSVIAGLPCNPIDFSISFMKNNYIILFKDTT
ncbi:MAG: hypothetical protein LBT79_02405, partial [Elusimicrobiota bacterium]|nr:hypothetical protein [Elusimicrobiota bacterium]